MTNKQSEGNKWSSRILRRYSLYHLHRQGLGTTISYFILFLAVGVLAVNMISFVESPLRGFTRNFNYFVMLLAILNIGLIIHLRKIQSSISLYDYLLKEVEFNGNTEIINAFFPFIANCNQKLKRPDTFLWTAIICSFFQERNLVLDRDSFCAILKEIVENDEVSAVLEKEYNFKIDLERDKKNIQKLYKTLPKNTNLISWQRFYGWRARAYASDDLIYFRSRTDSGFGVNDSLTLLPYNKGFDFDNYEQRRQRYFVVATTVREIVKDYMDQLQHPGYYCYPKSGSFIKDDTVENSYFLK